MWQRKKIGDMVMIHTNLTPRIVNTLFLLALQNYFSYHPEYTFSPIDGETNIDITTDFSEDGTMAANMPIVVVQNGASMIDPTGISTGIEHGVFKNVFGDTVGAGPMETRHKFTVRSSTIIHVFCFTKDACDELLFEISMLLMLFKYNIGNLLQIQNIEGIQITPASQNDRNGWSSKYSGAINIPYTFTVSRLNQPVSSGELLKAIQTSLKPVSGVDDYDSTSDRLDDMLVELRFKTTLECAQEENEAWNSVKESKV